MMIMGESIPKHFSIAATSHSLGTSDGYLNITNKATLFLHLNDEHAAPQQHFDTVKITIYIEDGNATVHAIT